jgi:hypothetical protein
MLVRRAWTVGLLALVVGFFAGYLASSLVSGAILRRDGQANFMTGYAVFTMGDDAWRRGDGKAALTWIDDGLTYLYASDSDLRAVGVEGASELANYLQRAEFDTLAGRASTKETRVIRTFEAAFKPFTRTNFDQIPDAEIRRAIAALLAAIASGGGF